MIVPHSGGLTPYQHALFDPCTGPMVSPYGGTRGFIQRFTFDAVVNTAAGLTAGIVVYYPGQELLLYGGSVAGGNNATLASFNNAGQAFLTNVASQVRCVSACMTVIPSAVSYNNITGEIGAGIVNWNTYGGGTVQPPTNAMTLCTSKAVLAKRSYDIKWYPNDSDHFYGNQTVGGAVNPPTSDVNGILLAFDGYPAGIALNIRTTAVLEWVPSNGAGLANPSVPGVPQNHAAQVAAMHTSSPTWWNNLANAASSAFNSFAKGVGEDVAAAGRYVTRKGISAAISNAERYLAQDAAMLAIAAI